jgi:hypothetical protein
VEWGRQRADLTETRAALRLELARNAELALLSLEQNQCFLKRDGQILRWAAGGPRPAMTTVGYYPVYSASTWEAARAGAVAHMPLEERTTYTRFYDLLANANENTRRHLDAVLRAAPYISGERLTADEAIHLRQEISVARNLIPFSLAAERSILSRARELKLPDPTLTSEQQRDVNDLCHEASQ